MPRNRARQRSKAIFSNLQNISSASHPQHGEADSQSLITIHQQAIMAAEDTQKLPRMKKFRFQLLDQWLVNRFYPCRTADIGGGKGLISFLLAQHGWPVTVIDPVVQDLPPKYKDIQNGRRIKISPENRVEYIQAKFEVEHAANFELLIGMHAHGCNAKIIDAAERFGCAFVIFPCCVIDEPFYPRLGVHWLESLADYAIRKGLSIDCFRLNFKGQNIGLFYSGRLKKIS